MKLKATLCCSVAILALMLHTNAHAQQRAFDLRSAEASSTIPEFARQAGIQILAPADGLKGVFLPSLKGNYDVRDALKLLLIDTDLEVMSDDGTVVRLHLVAKKTEAPAIIRIAADAGTPRIPTAPTPQAAAPVDEIIVSGSRITVSGYQQPTPVTVVDAAVLERDARPSIGDLIRQLPAVTGGASPFTQGSGVIAAGTAGLDTLNLRQLGTGRTLVLFDGQRVAQSVVTGEVDLSTIPNMLVQRIDVVTGGASAAWGSDAVSGVVNLVLNKTFDGLKVSADYGDTDRWDRKSYRVQAAAGTDFAGGRGHVIGAVNYVNSPEVIFAGQRDWNKYTQLLRNPAYTATNSAPQWIHVDNVGLSQATNGGLLVGHVNPVTGAAVTNATSPFRGIQFVGPNATPQQFNFGILQGAVCGNCSAEVQNAALDNLTVDFKSTTLFGLTTYDMTDSIKASLQVNYGRALSWNNSVPNTAFGNLRIPIDNAYLPASVKAQMQAAGVSQVIAGTTHLNNLPADPRSWDWDVLENTVGVPVGALSRRVFRTVFTLEGDIDDGWMGQNWTWDAYYQRGRSHMYQTTTNNNIRENLTNAIDAVVAPAGIAGITAGSIVCRSTLTAPTNGCVPLNIFGEGVASTEAIRYVNVEYGENFQDQHFKQDVYSLAFNGELPFGLPAGNPAMAFGAEYRREKGVTDVDGGAAVRRYALGNFGAFLGAYNVTEGFAEIDVPLLRDSAIQSLSFNAAGRVTHYSTSGTVNTWKAGLTGQIDDNIRLRGTFSRDIRAPNLNELFSQGVASTSSAVDPKTGLNVAIYTVAGGNTALTPELSKTKSLGVVLTPTFLDRFTASLDFYDIKIKDAIVTVNAAQTLQRCNAGETVYCGQLVYQGPIGSAGPALSQINTSPLNASNESARGLDFQADYTHPIMSGDLTYRFLGNYIMKQTRTLFGVTDRFDGSMGADGRGASVPKFRATLSATYDQGPASFTVQTRFIGKSKLGKYWTSKDVDKNEIPQLAYLDLRGSYQINDNFQVFGTIDNVMDQDPPNVPTQAGNNGAGIYYFTSVRAATWDVIGRAYRIGVRAQF